MTTNSGTPNFEEHTILEHNLRSNYYTLLGLNPMASPQKIRQIYRELSKLYHPDTTELPEAIATAKFQDLNEAYGTLSSPERRAAYDLRIGYSRVSVVQPRADLNHPVSESRKYRSSSAYLDPVNRPLSAGEIFALFILGITFVGCLILVFTISFTRGDTVQALVSPEDLKVLLQGIKPTPSAPSTTALDANPDDSALDHFEEPPSIQLESPDDRASDAGEDMPAVPVEPSQAVSPEMDTPTVPVEPSQAVSPEMIVEQFSFPAQPLVAPEIPFPPVSPIPSSEEM